MASYARLPAEPEELNFEYIQQCLKDLSSSIKQFTKVTVTQFYKAVEDINNKQENLHQIFKNCKVPRAEKAKINTLVAQFKELCTQFEKVKLELGEKYNNKEFVSSGSFASNLIEYEELAYKDQEELDKERLIERGDKINAVHKDVVLINEMFKDVANMVEEQGAMLNVAEKNVEVAVKQTDHAAKEMERAKEYQSSANKKKCIIIIVLLFIAMIATFFIIKYFAVIKAFFIGPKKS